MFYLFPFLFLRSAKTGDTYLMMWLTIDDREYRLTLRPAMIDFTKYQRMNKHTFEAHIVLNQVVQIDVLSAIVSLRSNSILKKGVIISVIWISSKSFVFFFWQKKKDAKNNVQKQIKIKTKKRRQYPELFVFFFLYPQMEKILPKKSY